DEDEISPFGHGRIEGLGDGRLGQFHVSRIYRLRRPRAKQPGNVLQHPVGCLAYAAMINDDDRALHSSGLRSARTAKSKAASLPPHSRGFIVLTASISSTLYLSILPHFPVPSNVTPSSMRLPSRKIRILASSPGL